MLFDFQIHARKLVVIFGIFSFLFFPVFFALCYNSNLVTERLRLSTQISKMFPSIHTRSIFFGKKKA